MTATWQSGNSKAADTLNRVQAYEAKRRSETITFSNQLLYDQLIDVFQECSQPDWDGAGAESVQRSVLKIAKELVESLPKAYRTPAISGEPDGHINLEWFVSPRRLLSVSVNPNRTLHWAALIGDEDPRGSCRFYDETPQTLLYWIRRVCQK